VNKNFNDIAKKVNDSIIDLEKLAYNIELRAANEAEVQLGLRTFATGNTGVKDVNGNKLTDYKEPYAKKRLKAGLQVANKDLVFKKQGSLIFSHIKIGTKESKPALGFTNKQASDVAGYQEKQNNTKIFQLTATEREKVNLAAKDYLFEQYKKMVQSWQ
jgi:hypothetical protein